MKHAFMPAGLLALALAAPVSAQSDIDAIENALKPDTATLATDRGTLGIDIVTLEDPGPTKVLELIEHTGARTISVVINFEFGSAELTPASKASIDKVAQAMNRPGLQDFNFLVGGHTDSKGTDELNDRLSRERAQAVVDYLALVNAVNPNRLVAYGFGERQPRNPADTEAPENRRVQFITLSKS